MEFSPIIRADFDRIALLSDDSWGHNSHYHPFLLRHVPSPCRAALDIGCGTGTFSRLLARRSEHVLGLDLSPQMIRVARQRSSGLDNLEYQVADVLAWDSPPELFNCVVSIATLHHLPLGQILSRMREALRPGGVLLILDLYQQEGPIELLLNVPAALASVALRLFRTHRLREPRAVREAWAAHGRNETFLTLSQIRRICADLLPGAQVKRHLLWRYSLIWEKTVTASLTAGGEKA